MAERRLYHEPAVRTISPRGRRPRSRRAAYADPAWFAREMDRIFARMWIAAGRVDELERPGAFIRRDVAGASVLIVRGADGRRARVSQRVPPSRHAALR